MLRLGSPFAQIERIAISGSPLGAAPVLTEEHRAPYAWTHVENDRR